MADVTKNILVQVGMITKSFDAGIKRVKKGLTEFQTGMKMGETNADVLQQKIGAIKAPMQKLGAMTKMLTSRFQGWALSIMFFGMAIQRLFMGITKFAFKTFNDIISSTNESVSSVALLSAAWQYLGFVVGSVLEPIIPMLMSIILWMAEWIEEHPRLARWLIIIGVIVGTLLMVFGMLVLGIFGIVQAMQLFGTTLNVVKNAGIAWTWFATILKDVGIAVGSLITKFLGLMGIGSGGITAGALMGALAFIATIVALIIYLGIKWEWNWKAMFANMIVYALYFLEALHLGFLTVGNVIQTIFASIFDGFFWLVDGAIWVINGLIAAANQIPGIDIGFIGKLDTNFIGAALKSWDKEIIDAKQMWREEIDPWEAVLDEWSGALDSEERVAEANAEPEGETAEINTFNIDQLTVQSNDAEGIVTELKNLSNNLNLGGFE